jgi:hypothetical protein
MFISMGGLAVALVTMLLTFGACRPTGGGAAATEPTPKRRRGRYERGRVDGELPLPVAARCVTMQVRRPAADGKLRPVEEISLEVDGLRSVAELRAAAQAALAPIYGVPGTDGLRIVHEKRDGDGLITVGAGSSLKDALRAKRLQVLLPEARADPRSATAKATAAAKPTAAKPGVAKPKGGQKDSRRRLDSSRSTETADVELGFR